MANLFEKYFENQINGINNNYIFNTYNENEISENEEFFRIENNISGIENENSGIDNKIDISNDNSYIFKSPNISEKYNINDSYETNEFKNNSNTVYKNETDKTDNNNKKLELNKNLPLIEEANLEKTSDNSKIILKKKRGRKKIDDNNEKGEEIDKSDDNNEYRAKYSIDNLIRRTKTLVLNSILQFDNYVILKAYNYNIGRGVNSKILLKNDYSQKRNTKIEFNINFLYKTQQEIFSAKISKKNNYQFPEDHNKKLIEELLEEKDEKKRNIFQTLFSKTFKECIHHICGNKYIECLEGLEHIYNKELIKMKEEENFKKIINDVLNNYEKKLNDRKPRKRK
jgi:hypothetical protein